MSSYDDRQVETSGEAVVIPPMSDEDRQGEKGAAGTETERKENEPTAVKREMEENTPEPGKTGTDEPRTVSQKVLVAGSRKIRTNNDDEISTLAKLIGAKIMQVDNWTLLNGGASETSSEGI